ncbi:ABC-F family ATP-binding cassette domain-containing protein [Achromobacter xylosoxidans]|uniref:ABC-F family ATP-binding cassette domain-containing protein n=1 Tax=Alcaligenes xylosoxydans xylosoxydans TaxID=85698 RepID=UPI0006C0E584|nr:ATP-binding cassette domain-containing protein [Achromobacter xylosoxidans]MBK1980860.1 ATP-binding cassette domain-containing protein [Achromobacter xylosoxidans]MCZ8390819.1 ATP-binding cassette domain-containing protein [Achromobacter xylosoxidans]MDH0522227.1 ATP-binding cassette domain-containing protein [Achromobacter xylosoxidans]MDH0542868.1 ATP-binding cassette domain-containing protein [Achromobacter xylosoxidans]MEC6410915.1 ATP-binding cassette domain-containing protein [Achromo
MIRASGLTLRRGTKVLLDDAEFVVHPGERVGIVGKNGAGKSSLFALLTGALDLDAGNLALPAGWRIASVEQELHADDRPAREFVIDGDTPLRALQARRAELTDDQGTQIAEVEAALVEAGAWSAASRAEQLLAGLGFKPAEWTQPVASFSGGWRMRLALARALMAPSELLLLDEPTNHLDLDAMLWLEKWLAAYPGTVMLISHDTEFLDAVAKSILHFDHAKLVRYRGGYGDFLTQRAERLRQTNIAYERQTREAARLQGFIDRFKAKASKAKQAQSRVKALARMQVLAPLHAEAGIDIRIPSPEQVPDPLLTLEHLSAGYTDAAGNDVPILRDVTLMVRAGSRVGVLGANGAGKSTLIKTLAEELPVQAGERRASRGLAIGYFHQHQLDMLDVDSTPLAHLARLSPETREQELRNYLGGFGFSGDTVNSKVGPMSGGEKARLALSLIVWQKPNLLLLDEPSNHLDVETREALAAALAEFGGSMLLVSHDRHLLRTTVDSFWIVADGAVREFDGDLEDYRDWLAARNAGERAEAARENAENGEAVVDRKAQRRAEAEQRQRLSALRKPLEAKLAKVEAEMEKLRAKLQALDGVIADPDLYSDARRAERQKVMAEHGEHGKRMETLEEQWLELQGSLEEIEQGEA